MIDFRVPENALRRAIAYFGTAKKLAQILNVAPPQISQWLSQSKLIDYKQAWYIDLLTDGQVAINELRPDCRAMNELIKKRSITDFLINEETYDIEVEISRIKILYSVRKDYGDLSALADNINQQGLLEPIGLNDRLELLYGERRLKAFQLLGRTHIPVRIFKFKSPAEILLQQHLYSKQLTISERAELGKILLTQIGERRGRRKKLYSNIPDHSYQSIATQVGFGNKNTFRLALRVIQQGISEIIWAVDAGHLSVAAADKLVRLPAPDQLQKFNQFMQNRTNKKHKLHL